MATTEFPPEASQADSWSILGPEIAGWIFQIAMSGVCFQKAADLYSKKSHLNKRMRMVLTSVVLLNTINFVNTIAELFLWSVDQNRAMGNLLAFKIPDTYQPILAGLIAAIVQAFFADRAWKICNKSVVFLVMIGTFMIASFAGAVGLGILQMLHSDGTSGLYLLCIFTELWTWTTVVTDLSISAVIIVGLLSKKTDHDMPTDNLVMQIANAALQSASLTTTFALAAGIAYAIQWHSDAAVIELGFIYALPSLYTYSLLWCLACTDNVRQEHTFRAQRSGLNFSMTPLESTTYDHSAYQSTTPGSVRFDSVTEEFPRIIVWEPSIPKTDPSDAGTERECGLDVDPDGEALLESLEDFLRHGKI